MKIRLRDSKNVSISTKKLYTLKQKYKLMKRLVILFGGFTFCQSIYIVFNNLQ